jgi:glycerol kinase
MDSVPLGGAQEPMVLVVDIGTSSMRAIVYDATARPVEGLMARHVVHAKVDLVPNRIEVGQRRVHDRRAKAELVFA